MIYRYSLSASNIGGEHTIGTINKDQAEYWLGREENELQDHIWDYDDADKAPKQFHLGNWNDEICDTLHQYGAEYHNSNMLSITDENTQNEIEIKLGNMKLVSTKTNVLEVNDDGNYLNKALNDKNKVLCYGQNLEKGQWDFELLETNHPVDISKFRFNITKWDTLWLLVGIEYDSNLYTLDDGDTVGKGFSFWIER